MTNAVWNEEEMATIQNKDRLLPSQPIFSKMYTGNDYYGDLENLLTSMYKTPPLYIEIKKGMTYSVMGSDFNTLHFLKFLIRSHGYKKVLELGTYIGVSAMYMADAGAFVDTVEKGEEFQKIARKNIVKNRFDSVVNSICWDAVDYLRVSRGAFDLIFIDCAKESYKELLELSLPRLNEGGMILVDDVFFQGDTLNSAPTSEKGKGVRAMLDYAATLDEWEKVILPTGNGLLMMRKRT